MKSVVLSSSDSRSMMARLSRPLLGVAVSVFAATAFAAGPAPVKLATVVWIGYGPFYVADALDLYK